MFERKEELVRPIEYPYEHLYRPWSWALSSFSNIFIFLSLLILLIVCLRRRRSSKHKKVHYRKLTVRDVSKEDSSGKVCTLVTGGNGCLGKALIKALVEDGSYLVYSTDLTIPSEDRQHPGVCGYLQMNLLDTEELAIAMRDIRPQVVFHMAGLMPRVDISDSDLYQVNEMGTRNIIEACKCNGVSRLLYTSTADVLMSSDPNQVLDEVDESTPLPDSPLNAYTGSKMNAEKAVIAANGEGQLLTCALRPHAVIGADSYMGSFFLSSRAVFIGSGKNKMNFVPVGACVRGHILAEKKLRAGPNSIAAGRTYHLCSDDSFEIREMLGYSPDKDSDITIWGFPPPRSYPRWLVMCAAVFNKVLYQLLGTSISSSLTVTNIDFLTRNYTYSNTRAHKELGWEKLPSWQEIVEDVVEEFEKMEESRKNK